MNFRFSLVLVAVAGGLISGCQSPSKPAETSTAPVAAAPRTLPTTLDEAVLSSGYRSEINKQRDAFRHPLETLTFFGIKPEMTVIEISPGGGWYMEILAPYLAANGHYVAAAPSPSPENVMATTSFEKVSGWLKENPEVSKNAKISVFSPPARIEIGPDKSADAVVTFRNVHNWMANDAEKAAFKAFFKALKPGGILGVVEHRADAKSKRDPKAKSGYVREADVIRLAESVGFKLVAKSEINANPKDTKDHPEGVWTLPPNLKLKDQDKEKYVAIGESDRMTLKFVRPKR